MERLDTEISALWLGFCRDESCTQQFIQSLAIGFPTRPAVLLDALGYFVVQGNRYSDDHDAYEKLITEEREAELAKD